MQKLFTTNLHVPTAGPDRLYTNKAVDNLRSCHDDPRCSRECTHLIMLMVGKINGGCIELTKVYSIESTLHVYRNGFDLY